MTKLIINADDFGYSKGVNLGIIETYKNGIVTSATMMTNMPGADDAAKLAKENPELGVGVHLVLDCGFPINDNVGSLIDAEGKFYKSDKVLSFAGSNDIEKEFTSQIEKFLSYDLTPTHLDSHHHIHSQEKVFPIVEKLANKYNLPIRNLRNNIKKSHFNIVEYFEESFYGDDLTIDSIIKILDKLNQFDTTEIMAHPAYIDEPVLTGSSYNLQRARELSILTDKRIQHEILNRGIELVSYRELKKTLHV
ncbi:chitin disaccharide deacetylase [Oceanobacillus arenosus]|uniref:Carbohydrate deacetylase n=1 Tax=Oceanobacillus arenosus TaxID=1229153 RepID=A0A3D8Q162_9BACI|nr:chitin disaccharide deacetylase [Oceanobacillus arenosus]RDW21338.1 chitin disaccharide deacetylase [Oceanobacillus arenosus]